jgi:hypothetical protein
MNVGNDGVISINSNQQTNIYQFLSLDLNNTFSISIGYGQFTENGYSYSLVYIYYAEREDGIT